MTLRHRLSLLVALALIPPLLLTLYNVVRSQLVVHKETREESMAAARLIAGEFAQVLEASRQLMVSMAKHPAVPDDETACAAYFRSVIAEMPVYREAAVIASNGLLHCATVPKPANPDVTNSRYFSQAMMSGGLSVGLLNRDRATGSSSLPVSMPYRAADGAIKGVIVLAIDPQQVARHLTGATWRSHYRVFVLDREGALVMGVPQDQSDDNDVIVREVLPRVASGVSATSTASATSGASAAASQGSTGTEAIAVKTPSGRSEMVGVIPVENGSGGLFVGVAIDQDVALADAKRVNEQSLAFALITMMLAVAGAWIATFVLIDRPIRAIVDTARRREEGDLVAPFPAFTSSAEFGQLSTALSRMSDKIHELLDRQGFLLRELQHRVMNSLTLLSSVLDMQRRHVRNAVAREHLERARDRVGAMATVYRYLYQTNTPDMVEFSEFLKVICAESQNAYAGIHKPTIALEADRLELAGSHAISLAMLTHELITNALKHAYPEGQAGRIDVTLKRSGKDAIELRVADQGRGIPEDFQIDKTTSLGMRLITSTVRQFGGTLDIKRRQPGTEFVIRIPAPGLAPTRS